MQYHSAGRRRRGAACRSCAVGPAGLVRPQGRIYKGRGREGERGGRGQGRGREQERLWAAAGRAGGRRGGVSPGRAGRGCFFPLFCPPLLAHDHGVAQGGAPRLQHLLGLLQELLLGRGALGGDCGAAGGGGRRARPAVRQVHCSALRSSGCLSTHTWPCKCSRASPQRPAPPLRRRRRRAPVAVTPAPAAKVGLNELVRAATVLSAAAAAAFRRRQYCRGGEGIGVGVGVGGEA